MLEGNSPNCSRLPHRYAISSPFFAPYFIISSAVLTDLFFDATNFSSHHNNCDTVSERGEYPSSNRSIKIPAVLNWITRPPTSRPPWRRAKRDQSPFHPELPRAPPAPPLRCRRTVQRSAQRYPSGPHQQPREPQSGNLSPLLGCRARLFACASIAPPGRRL